MYETKGLSWKVAATVGRLLLGSPSLMATAWIVLTVCASFASGNEWEGNLTLVDTASGTIGCGNYSYFELRLPGHVQLLLTSITGDADLYISSFSERPTYTNYDYKSATCGIDAIDVPSEAPRPVYVGVYGCLSNSDSEFMLAVYAQPHESRSLYSHGQLTADAASGHGDVSEDEDTSEEGSLLWHIITLFLKVVFEMLT